jgi:predicted CxxxxCH...CXXCH cytochrome family protein
MRINWQNLVAVCIGMVLWYSGCSELKKDLPAPVAPGVVVHETGWSDTAATNFHGKVLKAKGYQLSECTPCHAKSFQGGTSQVPCYTCHASYPHVAGWQDSSATGYHGNYLKAAQWNLSECQTCHGAQYIGGTSGVSCYTCHGTYPHTSAWNNPASADYHGNFLKAKNYQITECTPCHEGPTGGISQVSCYTCHSVYPHGTGWNDPASANSHGSFLKANQWNLSFCQSCHGQQFDGGTSGQSCYTCHSSYPHNAAWVNPSSPSYHGNYLKNNQWNLSSCQACHGQQFDGGTSGKSCYTCHASYPHNTTWVNPASPNYHGNYLKNNQWNLSGCQSCHGAQFDGGTSGVSCYTCHASYPHASAWSNPASPNSHGNFLKANQWNASSCQSCHGTLYDGGASGVSCYTCHASYPHSVKFGTAGHPSYLMANGFPLTQCQTCHGSSYAGGTVVNVSCTTSGCHVDLNGAPKSPEACNTCHGVFSAPASDFLSAAPPKSVAGGTATTVSGVGAHQAHLATGMVGRTVKCQECHQVPSQVFSQGHLGSGPPAEVVFTDTLARLITGDGTLVPNPSYDPVSLTCANSYCHGNWKLRKVTSQWQFAYGDSIMGGSNYSPVWTGGSSQAACGTCHGLPPQGHQSTTITGCAVCHAAVVNSAGVIIDKTKHVNGKINVFGAERDMK